VIGLLRRQSTRSQPIATRRLHLVTITRELLGAEHAGRQMLARALHAQIPPDWPPQHWEPHVRAHIVTQLEAHPESVGWHRYMLLPGPWETLIGCLGAFPCAPGDVEIGYSVADSYQRQGFGTEAAHAFVLWLLAQPSIHSVTAQTFESMPESIKVMERCGLRYIGAGDQPGTVRYRRWKEASAGMRASR
jgi:ribosomal-protein-alanine N-acetyltransferase